MKLIALLGLLVAACGTSSPTPARDGGGGTSGAGGASGASGSGSDAAIGDGAVESDAGYPTCPQHRVEGPECPSATAPGGVLRKDGHICATCKGVDSTGQPTAQPVGCTTVAGDDLCVADCGECS